jgi:hypothetical protein
MSTNTVNLTPQSEAAQDNIPMRIVEVKYNSCCGCGCTELDIFVKVPLDSHIQDGDIVDRNDIDLTLAAETREELEPNYTY